MRKDIKNWRELSDEEIKCLYVSFLNAQVNMGAITHECANCLLINFDAWFNPITDGTKFKQCLKVLEEYVDAKKASMS